MKSRHLSLLLIALLYIPSLQAHPIAPDWEELLRSKLNAALGSKAFSIEALEVNTDKKELTGIGTFFKKPGIAFTAAYEGDAQIGSFEAVLPENAKLSVSDGELKALAGQPLQHLLPDALSKSVYLERLHLQFSKSNKNLQQVDLYFNALKNWDLLSTANLALEQVKVHIQVDQPGDKQKRSVHGTLLGMTQIAGKTLDLSAALTDRKESLQLTGSTEQLAFSGSLESLLGRKWDKGLDIPMPVLDLQLSAAEITVAPYQDWMTLAANSNWGIVDLWLQKADKKDSEYVITISPPAGFRLSTIHKKLKALDGIDLGQQKIVISSADKDKKESSKIPSLSEAAAAVKKGCSLMANLDLTKLKIDHLIGLKNLIVSSPLGAKLAEVQLEAVIEKDIAIGETAQLKQVLFRLQPAPNNFAVTLLGRMDTKVQKDQLAFLGGVELELADQSLNFKALMDGDWNDPLGAKGLRVSDLGVQLGCSFTTAPVLLPNIALAGGVKIGRFEGKAAVAFDTRNPTDCMLSVGFNELILWDLVDLLTNKQLSKNLPKEMQKTLSAASFRDVEMEVVPVPMQVLEKSYDAGFRAGGKLDVAGFNAEGLLDIDFANGILASGAVDPIDLKIFKVKGANGHERPSLLIDLQRNHTPKFAINGLVSLLGVEGQTDIHIIENGFQFALGGKIFHLFAGDIQAHGTDVKRAGDMGIAVDLKNDFFKFLQEDVSAFVEKSTAAGVSKLQEAQVKLREAEAVVRSWDREINAKREEIKKKQAKHRKAFEAAQGKVNEAKATVNKLNKEIDALKAEAATKTKVTELPERTYLEGKIKTLQGTRLGALGILETANLGLEGLKWVNKDPDLDPAVIALKGKKEIALKSVQGARLFLQGTEKGLDFGGSAASWILEHGTKGIVDIQSARFAGNLGTISGGAVELELKVAWMGKTQNLRVAFDFNNMVQSVANVGKALLKL